MPRRQRIHLPGCSQHLLQRGVNRQAVFFTSEDRLRYLDWLRLYAEQRAVLVHAYCLMEDHVHLLVTAPSTEALSGLMQDISRRYSRSINRLHNRSGSLWDGRYKACHLQAESHVLLACMRYVELNPVRAGQVKAPWDYPWSSVHANAFGEPDRLVTPHGEYLSLAATGRMRQRRYREMLQGVDHEPAWELIRTATQQGGLAGDADFTETMTRRLGKPVAPRPRGRPRKTS